MSNPRETQFSGFASLLAKDIRKRIEQLYDEFGLKPDSLVTLNIHVIEPLLARAAYDLACHTVSYLDNDVGWRMGKGHTAAQIVENDVPDMAELPENETS